jgi:glycerate dehydrogenase
MKIVVLDACTINPGDLSWTPIEQLGQCVFFDRTSADELAKRVEQAEIILTNKVTINRAAMERAPRLKYIGVMATGYNIIDICTANSRGIVVTNVPAYGTASTAQGAIALLLELTNHVGGHDQSVHSGKWSSQRDFCYWDKPIIELSGLTMGVVGFGRIGSAVCRIAEALGMFVIVHSRSKRDELPYPVVSLETLLTRADVVSLHCSLTDDTKGIIREQTLAKMKSSALFINNARGDLVVEKDLAHALRTGQIAGAAIDVLTTEPPESSNPLLTAPNCIITPHNHWASVRARARLVEQTAINLKAFLEDTRMNVVN